MKTEYNLPALHAPSEIKKDSVIIRFRKDPFRPEIDIFHGPSGISALAALRIAFRANGISTARISQYAVFVDGVYCSYTDLPFMVLYEDQVVHVAATVHGGGGDGGKNPITTIISLAAIAIAPQFGTWAANGIGFDIGVGLSELGVVNTFGALEAVQGIVGAIAAGAVVMGAGMLSSAIAPVSAPSANGISGRPTQEESKKLWSIDGSRNKVDLYGVVPLVIGKVRFSPRLAAVPYSYLKDEDKFYRYLYVVSLGDVRLSGFKIGDTALETFEGVTKFEHQAWSGEALEYFDTAIKEETLSILLKQSSGWQTRTTPLKTTRASVEVTFQTGLEKIDNKGNANELTIDFEVRFREFGSATWGASTAYSVTNKTRNPFRRGFEIELPSSGQWDISIRRITEDPDYEATTETTLDKAHWTVLRSFTEYKSIDYRGRRMTLVELEIKASDQLSGSIDEFSCVCESKGLVTDDFGSWTEAYTSNCAALAAYLIQNGDAVGEAEDRTEIDHIAYKEFYDWCELYGWEYNSVITSRQSVRTTMHNILAAGRASYLYSFGSASGQHSVVFDDPSQPIIDAITPRTAWGFSERKEFLSKPIDGLRFRFINEEKDYQEDERIVYADNVDASNAQNVIEWEQDGVTTPDLVYKHGRLRLAELELRPAEYTFNTDFRSIAYSRGSRIKAAYDVTYWGIVQGRVMKASDDGTYITSIVIDEEFTMETGKNYQIEMMGMGQSETYAVNTVVGTGRELFFTAQVPIANGPVFDDLVGLGETSRTSVNLLVTSVQPESDITARITAVDAADNLMDAISGPIPAFDSNITAPSRVFKEKPSTPIIESVRSDEWAMQVTSGGNLVPRVQITFSVPAGGVEAVTTVCYGRKVGEQAWLTLGTSGAADGVVYANGVEEGAEYQIRLQAQTRLGVASDFSAVTNETVVGKSTPPPDVSAVQFVDGYVTWLYESTPIDFAGFEVRYSTLSTATWDNSLAASGGLILNTKFDARSYNGALTFFVKAYDVAGNQSVNAGFVQVDLGDVAERNILEQINQAPVWEQAPFLAYPPGNELYYEEGRYVYSRLINADIADGKLVPYEAGGFFEPGDKPMFNPPDKAFFDNTALPILYHFIYEVQPRHIGEKAFVSAVLIGEYTLEFREISAPLDDSNEFIPVPEAFEVHDTFGYEFRFKTIPGQTVSDTTTSDIIVSIDVDDIEEVIQEFSVPIGGARLPIVKEYTAIKYVLLALKSEAGGAISAQYEDKDNILGPKVIIYDKDKNSVAGTISAQVRGY